MAAQIRNKSAERSMYVFLRREISVSSLVLKIKIKIN